MNNYFKLGAAGCCVLYLLLYLFLPVLALPFVGIGASGSQLLSAVFWPWLVIIGGIAMGVCAMLLEGKPAALVSLLGAFLPMVSFLAIRGQVSGLANSIVPVVGNYAGALLNMGLGVILPMLCGFGSAVLCFLSDGQGRTHEHSAGLGKDDGNEWGDSF